MGDTVAIFARRGYCLDMDSNVAVPTRVRQLIGESGLAQGEFAIKAGLDTSKMSKSLSGTRRFTSLDLANIAEVAGVTVDWLLHGDGLSPAMAARADVDRGAAVSAAIGRASAFAQTRADLKFLTGTNSSWVDLEFPRTGRWLDQAAELVAKAVRQVEARGLSPTDLTLANVIEVVFGIDVAIIDIEPGCDGLAWRDADARLIVAATSATPTRQRFTLAHELGHLLAGDDQALHVDQQVMGPGQRGVESEVRANAFAAGFLMPEERLRAACDRETGPEGKLSEIAFSRLVMEFAVSPSAMAFRLWNIGLISQSERSELVTLRTKECASRADQAEGLAAWIEVSRRFRPPMALARDCLTAYFAGLSTLRPAANVLGADVEQLRQLLEPSEQAPMPQPREERMPV